MVLIETSTCGSSLLSFPALENVANSYRYIMTLLLIQGSRYNSLQLYPPQKSDCP